MSEVPQIIRCTRCGGTFYGANGEGDRMFDLHLEWCPLLLPYHPTTLAELSLLLGSQP